jgi:cellulose synthase (UDP-forming)
MRKTTTRLMNRWGSVGEQTGYFGMLLRLIIYCALLGLAFECATMIYQWPEQAVLAVATILVGYMIHRISGSEAITIALMLASLIATARYAYWRISTVWTAIAHDGYSIGFINIFFMLVLLSAECYAFSILVLGYFQTVRPLRRPPVAMPDNLDEWPHIDVLIPTYNEDLAIVRTTAIAAMNMDYPYDKLHVYVLDDGRRPEFREFCESVGVGYITRNDNKHAKAGNINAALKTMSAPYAAIFDCDHIPTRSFLQLTLAWFLKDQELGMLQTPHFFYSPDPFERNLHSFMEIPNEGELFYGLIQDGNDLWNATFFCGSCAILRRTAIDEIGGIAVETVTEDAHTSLRMQSRGWNTAYINLPQAAGLATDSLAGHVGQRIRWARGMIQILRTDNPFFNKGLDWPQRICYSNAMIHFLYAGPRLIFLTSPLIYMIFGCINIPGYWAAILVYAAPHLFLSNLANFRMQGRYRYSFWNEVYETVLAPYILGPTLLALINPKLGKFNVTAKGGIVNKSYFDADIARPYVFLILLNVLGLVMAPIRFFWWNQGHPGTIVMNVIWILFNLVILGTANAVAYESKQTREDVRIVTRKRVAIELKDGRRIAGETVDLSLGGARLTLPQMPEIDNGTGVKLIFPQRDGEAVFPVQVVAVKGKDVRIAYDNLSEEEKELLTLVLYGDADAWLSRMEYRKTDRPMHSFGRLMRLSVRGVYWALFGWLQRKNQAAATAAVLAFVMLLAGAAQAQSPYIPPLKPLPSSVPQTAASAGISSASSGVYESSFTLKDVGVPQEITFRGVDASQTIPFSVPHTAVVSKAVLKLHYAFSPSLIVQLSHLNVFLNDTLVATLPVPPNTGQMQKALDAEIPLPADMIVRDNTLRFQSVAHYTMQCEDPSHSALWSRVENTSRIELSGAKTDIADDLKILPLPFYDGSVGGDTATLPVIFASQPDKPALNAAGVVASWFGVQIKSKPLNFPVMFGPSFPKGNAILLVENSQLPPGLNLQIHGPVLAMRTNPVDQYGKILIVAGTNPEQLLVAAQALATGSMTLQGDTAEIGRFELPSPRSADDAPLWLPTDRNVPFWDYSSTTQLQSDGSGPVAVYLRTPPDLFFGDRKVLPMRVNYRYNAVSLANESTLRIDANSAMVQQLPMPHEDNPHKQLTNEVSIPLVNMRPFANTMLFKFYFQIAKKGNCVDTPPINLQGGILRDSYLDIKGLYHWAAMPNLELFSNAGFPFTRYADLAQTKIVLPLQATGSEVGLYLSLMGYFGERTGYPAVRVQVADPSELGQDADYLVLGTATDQPAFEKLNEKLPVAVHQNGYTIQDSGGIFQTIQHAWWQVAEMRPKWYWKLGKDEGRSGVIESVGSLPDAIIQGIESPWHTERSIVTITLKQSESATPFIDAFWKVGESSDISESVSVLHGSTFSSYRVGDRFYHVGQLPWWERLRYWLVEFPWIIVPTTFILGLFVVPWIRLRLDKRARARLNPPPAVTS